MFVILRLKILLLKSIFSLVTYLSGVLYLIATVNYTFRVLKTKLKSRENVMSLFTVN